MSTETATRRSAPTGPPRPTPPDKTRRTVAMVALASVILLCFWLVESRWSRLPEFPFDFARYLGFMAEGVFANPVGDETLTGFWTNAAALMIESLHMAWIGTIIGAIFSLPMGFLAARNVSPRPVVAASRAVLNAIRAIPELIWAIMIMLPVFGLGPVSGAMALGINSIGTLGKLTSEVIEGIDPGPVEAARASGARQLQILRWGTLPQVMPEVVAFWLYRFEINIRAGAILGVVAAGGIGSLLSSVLGRRLWERAGIMLAVIVLVTIAVDMISARLRRRIIAGPGGDDDAAPEETSTHAGAYV
ncbi:MAG: phosphonate ABC transporter, permease protein PhnE [Nitriliruptor sp.]